MSIILSDPYGWLDKALARIHRANWHRSVQTIHSRPGPAVVLKQQNVLNFASNDYLGLAADHRLAVAAIAAVQEFGTGSTGSRLLSGDRPLHRQLELAIADLKQTEDALVFSSGYLANLGTVAALVGARDLILSDQYNHSSLRSGATLSQATVINYAHSDMADLATKLEQHRDRYQRCLILSDSVFSMDGDLCPLPQILAIAEQFSCMVLIDEAHATGVLGPTGAGSVEHFGCTGPVIQVGTLSKALGSLGGYVAGSSTLIDFLRNRAPSWIYTTALSPADTAAALAAIAIVQAEPWLRSQLWHNVSYLKQQLSRLFDTFNSAGAVPKLLPSNSPIICLQMPSTDAVLQAGCDLQQAGIFVAAVRPPTVPTSRIRLSVMANHTAIDCQQLVTALTSLCS